MATATDQEWAEFKAKFDKSYPDKAEDDMRRELFAKVKAKVEEHNRKYEAKEVTFRMGINHMSDFTEEEFAMRSGKRVPPN